MYLPLNRIRLYSCLSSVSFFQILLCMMTFRYVRSNTNFFDLVKPVKNIKKIDMIIVRHAETIANRNNLLQGHCDYPLTDEGIAEANVLGVALSKVKWSRVFTSDLMRAQSTTNHILKYSIHNHGLFVTKQLREVCFGVREALPRGTSVQEAKTIIAVRESITDISMIHDHAEHDSDVHHRQWLFLNEMLEVLSESVTVEVHPKVLVVTHGAFIRLFLREFCRITEFDKIINCSVTKVCIEISEDGSTFSINADVDDVNNDHHLKLRHLPIEELAGVYRKL